MSNKFFRQTLAQIKYNSKEIKLQFPYVVQAQYEHCKQLIPIYNSTVYKNKEYVVELLVLWEPTGLMERKLKELRSGLLM